MIYRFYKNRKFAQNHIFVAIPQNDEVTIFTIEFHKSAKLVQNQLFIHFRLSFKISIQLMLVVVVKMID